MSVDTRPAATNTVTTSGSGSPARSSVVGDAASTRYLRATRRGRGGLEPSYLAIGTLLALSLAPIGTVAADEALAFRTAASPDQEVQDPAVISDGAAQGTFIFERDQSGFSARVSVQRLTGVVVASHLHCANAGANGPIVVNLNPTLGGSEGLIIDQTFTNANVTPGLCATECGFEVNNIASVRFAAEEGCIYLNVHTDIYGAGEVRGQLLVR